MRFMCTDVVVAGINEWPSRHSERNERQPRLLEQSTDGSGPHHKQCTRKASSTTTEDEQEETAMMYADGVRCEQ